MVNVMCRILFSEVHSTFANEKLVNQLEKECGVKVDLEKSYEP